MPDFYYKKPNALLRTKHELTEGELENGWEPITKEEFLSIKKAHEPKRKEKVEKPQEEETSNA